MRTLKIAGVITAAVVAVAVLLAIAVLVLVDPNEYRGRIERITAEKTGRPLQINGKLHLQLWPFLGIAAEGVRLGNPAGFATEMPFLTVARASIGVRLLPILHRRLEVTRVAVDGLQVNLIARGPNGAANNWKDFGGSSASGSAAGTSSMESASIDRLDITNSALIYRDETHGSITTLTNVEAHTLGLGMGAAAPTRIRFDYGKNDQQPRVHIAINGRVEVPPGSSKMTLSDLDMVLNDTHVRGTVALDNSRGLAVQFDLHGGNIDLDSLVPPTRTSANGPSRPTSPTSVPVDTLRALNAHGMLTADRVTVEHLVLTGVSLPVAADHGRVHVGPTRAGLFGGRVDGDVVLETRGPEPRVSLNEHLADVDVGALMKALYHVPRIIGRADANAELSGIGTTDTAIIHSLNGKMDVNVRNGALDGVDLGYQLRVAQALLRRETPPQRTGPERTAFTTLSGTGVIENGVVRNDDLRISTDYLKVSGKGTLDMNTKAVDYRVVAEPYATPAQARDGELAGLEAAGLEAAGLPLAITGTLGALKVRPDIQSVAQAAARKEMNDKVKEKTDALKQKLSEKLKGLLGH